ncbi:MAG: TonB family protein [Calditerrivibrio sp.]|nr:TonB family protein [Calditerrivibrio sp.]
MIFIYFTKLPDQKKEQKKEPTYVDIIKFPRKPVKILPEKYEIENGKQSIEKRPQNIIPESYAPKIGDFKVPIEEKKDPVVKKEEEHKPPKIEPSPIETVEEKHEEVKREQPVVQEKKDEQKVEEKKKLTKEQMAKILNPKDVIGDIAKKENKEEEVDFNRFEVKYTSYFYKFKQRLYNVWRYPSESVLKGEQGTVRIKFSILKDGTITNINLVSSSGYSALDRAAVDALKTMGKVPLPESFGLNILNVDGYFIYTISGMWIR